MKTKIQQHSPVPFGYRLFTDEEKHNPSKSIFKVLGAIWWGKHSGIWRSLADYHHDQGSSLVFAVPDIEQIADLKAQVAEKDKVIEVLAEDRERWYLTARNSYVEPIAKWAIHATITWAEAKAKEA